MTIENGMVVVMMHYGAFKKNYPNCKHDSYDKVTKQIRVFIPESEYKPVKEERKYFVKENWIFNLESCDDRIWCIEYDIQEKKISFPFVIANKTINGYEDLESLRNECYELKNKAMNGRVTASEYGRIKEIVSWRVEQRYLRCLSSGMDEREAGICFQDL